MNKIANLCQFKDLGPMGLFGTKQSRLNRRFRNAVGEGDFKTARQALDEGAEINHASDGRTALYSAVYGKEIGTVRFLLGLHADPNFAVGDNGHTALMEAASDGSLEIAQMLVEAGAQVNARQTDNKWTALHFAARNGRGNVITYLVEKGADRQAADDRMNTPADIASAKYPKLAEFIRGVNPVEQPKEPEPVVGWRLSAPDEVSNVTEKPEIGYRLTEIFNFGAGTYTRIAQNMKTGAESQSLRFFDEFTNRAAIETAREALTRLGGKAPESRKPVFPAPGAGVTP